MTMNTSLQQPLVSSYELDLDLLEVGEDKPWQRHGWGSG
jgi:hypothetical protein